MADADFDDYLAETLGFLPDQPLTISSLDPDHPNIARPHNEPCAGWVSRRKRSSPPGYGDYDGYWGLPPLPGYDEYNYNDIEYPLSKINKMMDNFVGILLVFQLLRTFSKMSESL